MSYTIIYYYDNIIYIKVEQISIIKQIWEFYVQTSFQYSKK